MTDWAQVEGYPDFSRTGKIITSPEARLFALRNSGTEVALNDIAHDGTKFVVVGTSGLILSSPNGIDWSMDATDEAVDLHGIAFGNGRFVATSRDGTAHTWTDGSARQTTRIAGADYLRVVFHKGKFFALNMGTAQVFVSSDGLQWTSSPAPSGILAGLDVSDARLWVSGVENVVIGSLIYEGMAAELRLSARIADGALRLTIHAPAPGNYGILRAANVSAPPADWSLRETIPVNGSAEWADSSPLAGAAFYQAQRVE